MDTEKLQRLIAQAHNNRSSLQLFHEIVGFQLSESLPGSGRGGVILLLEHHKAMPLPPLRFNRDFCHIRHARGVPIYVLRSNNHTA